jgi:hypothetical protein
MQLILFLLVSPISMFKASILFRARKRASQEKTILAALFQAQQKLARQITMARLTITTQPETR